MRDRKHLSQEPAGGVIRVRVSFLGDPREDLGFRRE